MSRISVFLATGCLALSPTVVSWAAFTGPAMVEAARNDDASAVTALISRHSDVNAKSDDGATALAWSAMRSNLQIAQALLKAGANSNLASVTGITPLALAILNGSEPMIRLLLEHGANPNLARDSGESPLMTASRLGRVDVMQLLIAHGADVNAKESQFQQTALMWAAAGHPDAVRLLLDHKADLGAATKTWDVKARKYGNGFTTLGKTGIPWVSQGEFDTKVGGYNALLFAVEKRDVASSRMLLDAGADINKAAADGATALLLALYKFEPSSGGLDSDLPMASFLLDRGAKANVADLTGYTPLHGVVLAIVAASKPMPGGRRGGGRPAADAPPKVNANPIAARTAAVVVSRRGGIAPAAGAERVTDLLAMAKRLLDAGADPNRQTVNPTPGPIGDTRVNPAPPGSSPFHIAASVSNLDLIRLLEAHGANPNSISQEGHSPFTVAVKSGNLDVLKEMVAHSADLSARYNPDDMVSDPVESIARPRKGQTVMHVAVVAGQAPVIQYLYSIGVPLELKNEANETPLMLADSQERYQFALTMQNGRGATRSTALTDTIKKLLADGPSKGPDAKVGIN
jgi:ankyrin repeat protein